MQSFLCLVCFSKQVLPTNPRDEEYEEVVVEEEGNKSDSDMSDWCYKPLRPGGMAPCFLPTRSLLQLHLLV